jgi:uncharacterized RmlC-like cupin family protein
MDKKRTCRLIRSSRTYHGKQGFDYAEAISKESVDFCISQLGCPISLIIRVNLNPALPQPYPVGNVALV